MQTARQLVNEAWNEGLKPPPLLSVSEWADRYRVVVSPSPEPGEWRTRRTPFLRQIMDCLSPTSAARTVAIMKGSQMGCTELALNWLGYKIHQYPSSFLIVLPTQGVAEEWSKTRLDQMVEYSPAIKDLILPAKSRDAQNTIFNKRVAGGKGLIKFSWSSSAAKLRSTPASDLILDEVDGFEGDTQGEGDPVTSLKRRFTNFARGKMLMISTPTGEIVSRIAREFEAGDQRHYFMPCPFCQHYQRFTFKQLVWPHHVPDEFPEQREARYAAVGFRCLGCAELIPEWHKTRMLADGIWAATVTRPELAEKGFAAGEIPALQPIFDRMNLERAVSFHLPSGCSPLGWYSWSTIAGDWEAAQKSRQALKVFIMQVLGEVWKEPGEAPDDQRVWERRERYEHFSDGEGLLPWNESAVIPKRGLFLTAAVDVQGNPARLEVGVKAWGRGKEAWHLGYWVFGGDVSNANSQPWRLLADLLAKDFPHANGGTLPIWAMGIDTGFEAGAVYDFALRHPQPAHNEATGSRVHAMRSVVCTAGASDWHKIIASVSKTDAARKRQNVRIWKVGHQRVKSELFAWLKNLAPPENGAPCPGYQHYPDYARSWFRGLCSEQVLETKSGERYYDIIPGRERNEPLDTEVYQCLCAALCGADRWKDGHWRELEKRLGVATVELLPAPVTPVAPQRVSAPAQIRVAMPPPAIMNQGRRPARFRIGW